VVVEQREAGFEVGDVAAGAGDDRVDLADLEPGAVLRVLVDLRPAHLAGRVLRDPVVDLGALEEQVGDAELAGHGGLRETA
jgi:hypothetical protein